MDSGTDEPMEAEDMFAQRQREAAVVAHKDGRSAFWKGAGLRGLACSLNGVLLLWACPLHRRGVCA